MGITIHASGSIDRVEDIPRLVEDVKIFAEENHWEYHTIDDDFGEPPTAVLVHASTEPGAKIEGSLGLKGIVLSVESGVEPLALLFDESGTLTDLMSQVSWIQDGMRPERFSTCKTQFGPIEAHICIVDLLSMLKEKYLTNLVVTDEGLYWESRDRELLADKRKVLSHYIRHTEETLRNTEIPGDTDPDPDSVASAIEEALLKADAKTKKV